MKYTPPIGGAANDPYVDANPATGVEGSPVPAAAIEHPQREIANVITAAGLTPDVGDLTQLYQAIQRIAVGGDYKASVLAATTANIALTGLQTVDGVALAAGDRVLVKNQTAGADNGIYLASAGAWTRTTDADAAGELTSGAIVPVESGTLNADTLWMLTTDGTITIGTTALVFEIKSGNEATKAGVQQAAYSTSAAGGTADAITGTFTPAITALTNGMTLYVRAASANATATPTFSPNGLDAKTIVKGNGLALAAGDIAGGGHWIGLRYDSTLDKWVLSNPLVVFSSAAENAAGAIENKAVDPLGIREAFNASGSAPVYACRAWVNFNGTGTVAIRASGNVSSITDNGEGDYTVNFTTALPDANYGYALGARNQATGAVTAVTVNEHFDTGPTTTACRLTVKQGGTFVDITAVVAAFFR